MLSSTFLKTSKISFYLSSFFDLEEFNRKGGTFLKLEFIELELTFGVLVVILICGGMGCFFSISSSSFISICFDLCSSSSFPLYSVITLTFSFGFNAWDDNFPFICASNFLTLEVTCPICFSKL
jgi:hypothetical protein